MAQQAGSTEPLARRVARNVIQVNLPYAGQASRHIEPLAHHSFSLAAREHELIFAHASHAHLGDNLIDEFRFHGMLKRSHDEIIIGGDSKGRIEPADFVEDPATHQCRGVTESLSREIVRVDFTPLNASDVAVGETHLPVNQISAPAERDGFLQREARS